MASGKIRLTGGEPLLRRDLERLVAMLAKLSTADGTPLDLTLTTNGSLLEKKAGALRAAGLGRVTVSLDALDDAIFRRMNDADFPVADVLRGIDAAERAGLGPIKVNMVVKRGTNDQEIVPMARHFRGRDVALRFIEYMDVGATNGWRMDEVLPSAEVVRRLGAEFGLARLPASAPGETAERWRYGDGAAGEIGTISSVTKAFCRDCNRARLSTEGKLFLCLFASRGHDLRGLVRGGASDAEIAAAIGLVWQGRDDRYSELRGSSSEPRPAGRAARRDALHRRVSDAVVIRPLATADLADYKRLRDAMLAAHPEAFTSDADSEADKEPLDYLQRLGLDRQDGGHFVLGAWHEARLLGAIGCERETRLKVRHIGHIIGMMVRAEARGRGIGAELLEACIAEARHAGLEMLTLSVTGGNDSAIRLYERHRFVAYGNLRGAIKVGTKYHDKLHMVLVL